MVSCDRARDGDISGRVRPVRFVDHKVPDWTRVQQLLRQSEEAGRWANFGPVQQRLTEEVASLLGLDRGRAVISSSSGTAALFALAGAHAERAGRHLVWAISAFGFFSTAIGPLAGRVRVIDCDLNGTIDIARLAKLSNDQWDGLIVTDLFGAQSDFTELSRLCEAAGKRMIVDSAVSFPARRSKLVCADEIVSFHHTKPWGFGEGGCVVVDAVLADRVRSFVDFGSDTDPSFWVYAQNGKLSDVAAALILQRLETMDEWAKGYRRQRQRITELALSEGLNILVRPDPDVVVPHVPILAARPFSLKDLTPRSFVVERYYRPLSEDCRVAMDLYSRLVNVPCHPGMETVDDRELRRFFSSLSGGTSGQ